MSDDSGSVSKKTISYHYLKSNFFRVVYGTGVYGGVTPKGELQMAIFNERHPIPKTIVQTLESTDGVHAKVGAEVSRVTKDGVVREVEVEILMNLETAKAVHKWLGEHIGRVNSLAEHEHRQ